MRELLNRSLGGNIDLRTEFEPNLWLVEVDPSELELVLLNLGFNARDAMPGGGTITVRAENVPRVASADDGRDCVRLSVNSGSATRRSHGKRRGFPKVRLSAVNCCARSKVSKWRFAGARPRNEPLRN